MNDTEQSGNSPSTRLVSYLGGMVCFHIPADWVEESEPDGTGMFYAPGDNTGTLRLSVITATAKKGERVTNGSQDEFLAAFASKHGSTIQSVRTGIAVKTFDTQAVDRGQNLRLRSWQFAQALPPVHIRSVIFSYTLPESHWGSADSQRELDKISQLILASEFAPEVGELQPIRKPWWRFW